MATQKNVTVTVTSTSVQGTGFVEYDASTMLANGVISLKWLNGSLAFSTVAEYTEFVNTVVIPLTNTIYSPSGTGSGYVAMAQGVPGSDVIVNTVS